LLEQIVPFILYYGPHDVQLKLFGHATHPVEHDKQDKEGTSQYYEILQLETQTPAETVYP